MAPKTTRQFGLWESSITARSLAEGRRLEAAKWDTDGQSLIWLEGRSGRGVLVAQAAGGEAPRELSGELDVRAEVGYGGGDFTVHGGFVYFVVHKTGRIFRQAIASGSARPVTPPFGKASSPVVSPDGRWVAYLHDDQEGNDRLAVVDAEGSHWPRILAAGHDFYMQPCWSPDARHLCWIAWDHPNMPWDGTTLELAQVIQEQGSLPRLDRPTTIAGDRHTAIFQPEFMPDGRLLYVSDESGWGRIVLHDVESGERRWLTPDGVEHGSPAWGHAMRNFAVSHDGRQLVAARSQRGFQRLFQIDVTTGENTPVGPLAPYTEISQIVAAPHTHCVAFLASSSTIAPRLVQHDFSNGKTRIVARATGETVPRAELAECEAISWETAQGERAHGLYYAPASDRFEGVGKPPLIVLVHGGPTSQAKAGWKSEAQFFATRGYAVLFVNYRGSTGYGREYLLKLRGNWGICDVEDAISGARHLADSSQVDPERTVIMGGSAGGFTVLQVMTVEPKAFTAGICLYGVANQFQLAAETHKFESRYTDSLLGPLPEAAVIYRERSPALHADRIQRPLAVFQGEIDRVVPREQSDSIVDALKRNGTPHVYHVYEGEGHGWRKRETIEHFYTAVERFLSRHVLFT